MENKAQSEKTKLNLGCGAVEIDGYVNLDIQKGEDQAAYPLMIEENSCDEIRASHLLEHFGYEETAAVLADWVSKLKPGGILKIAVPDFDKIIDYFKDKWLENPKLGEAYLLGGHVDENDHHKAIFTREKLMQQMQDAGLKNVCDWSDRYNDCSSLKISLNLQGMKPVISDQLTVNSDQVKTVDLIDEVTEKRDDRTSPPAYGLVDYSNKRPYPRFTDALSGMVEIEPWDEYRRLVKIKDLSRNELKKLAENTQREEVAKIQAALEAKSAAPVMAKPEPKAKIAAVMSMPRLAFTDNMFCATSVFGQLGIEIKSGVGAFWEQCLTRAMEEYVSDGYDYLITIDYDTYYTKEQVVHLCNLMQANPDVSAIVSTQAKREDDLMLMGWNTPTGEDPGTYITEQVKNNQLVQIVTGHFGLTIIDCNALRTISKPWFWAQPSPDGTWNDDRIDADISFWHNMQEHGKKVMLATDIKLGHLQMMVTYPGPIEAGLKPEHHYITDIKTNGIPDHCKIKL